MTVDVTLSDLVVTASFAVPSAAGAIFWAARTGVRSAIKDLRLDLTKEYVSRETCKAIREDCHARMALEMEAACAHGAHGPRKAPTGGACR